MTLPSSPPSSQGVIGTITVALAITVFVLKLVDMALGAKVISTPKQQCPA